MCDEKDRGDSGRDLGNTGRLMHVKKQSSGGVNSAPGFTAVGEILTVMATYDRGRAMEAGSDCSMT